LTPETRVVSDEIAAHPELRHFFTFDSFAATADHWILEYEAF
jgi:hypothetical protein